LLDFPDLTPPGTTIAARFVDDQGGSRKNIGDVISAAHGQRPAHGAVQTNTDDAPELLHGELFTGFSREPLIVQKIFCRRVKATNGDFGMMASLSAPSTAFRRG